MGDSSIDPHILGSLFKLWPHELVDLLVPLEMYNNYIIFAFASDAGGMLCHQWWLLMVYHHVILFIINFLQLFTLLTTYHL
jgi:hypothetical protein